MNNMNFEEFVLQIQNLLRESDSNLDIQVQEVSKNNSIHYTGLTCRNINTAVSPVILLFSTLNDASFFTLNGAVSA